MAAVNNKARLGALAGAALLCLAVAVVLLVQDQSSGVLSPEDAKNVEAIQADTQNTQEKGPPPVRFAEPPVKPSNGTRDTAP